MAGTMVAAAATAGATATTNAIMGTVIEGAPGAPVKPALALLSGAASSRPATSPAAGRHWREGRGRRTDQG